MVLNFDVQLQANGKSMTFLLQTHIWVFAKNIKNLVSWERENQLLFWVNTSR